MAYWITTHWPRRQDQSVIEPRSGVWVKDKQRQLIDRVHPGDLVFIYESKSGPAVETYVNGSVKVLHRHPGREGIVALVQVTEAAEQPQGSVPEHYADGSSLWWRYRARTRSVNSAGFIPRRNVNLLLGYAENNFLHGFGEKHSGLKEISEELYKRLFKEFSGSAHETGKNRVEQALRF